MRGDYSAGSTYLTNIFPETFSAKAAQNEPHFQGSKTATEGEMPITEVDYSSCTNLICKFLQIERLKRFTSISVLCSEKGRCNVKCVREMFAIPYPECRRIEVYQAPLLRELKLVTLGRERETL